MPTHSFEYTTPPARFDAIPWTRVLVEQAAPETPSVWTEIDDQAIAVDLTPATPNPISLTVTTATLERAFFRFRFDTTPSNPSTYSPAVLSPPPPYRPTVEQVAAIVRSRTRGAASRDATIAGEQGTFTATTRPTYLQVQELIDVAVGDIAGMMRGRTPCTPVLETAAGSAAAYLAAQLVEVSYYSEQTTDETTAFKALDSLRKDAAKAVAESVIAQCPLTAPDGSIAGAPTGRTPVYERLGWGTRW